MSDHRADGEGQRAVGASTSGVVGPEVEGTEGEGEAFPELEYNELISDYENLYANSGRRKEKVI